MSCETNPLSAKGVACKTNPLSVKGVSCETNPLSAKGVSCETNPLSAKGVSCETNPLSAKGVSCETNPLSAKGLCEMYDYSTLLLGKERRMDNYRPRCMHNEHCSKSYHTKSIQSAFFKVLQKLVEGLLRLLDRVSRGPGLVLQKGTFSLWTSCSFWVRRTVFILL